MFSEWQVSSLRQTGRMVSLMLIASTLTKNSSRLLLSSHTFAMSQTSQPTISTLSASANWLLSSPTGARKQVREILTLVMVIFGNRVSIMSNKSVEVTTRTGAGLTMLGQISQAFNTMEEVRCRSHGTTTTASSPMCSPTQAPTTARWNSWSTLTKLRGTVMWQ